jgi:hypothetical protein
MAGAAPQLDCAHLPQRLFAGKPRVRPRLDHWAKTPDDFLQSTGDLP